MTETPAFIPIQKQGDLFVIFDLDGTIACDEHRVHHLNQHNDRKPDWPAYFAAAKDDTPMPATVAVLDALVVAGHQVEIWTGRPESLWDVTRDWLIRHRIPAWPAQGSLPLRMRGANDYRSVQTVKGEWLAAAPRKPDLVFDDRNSSVDWWRAQGIPCFHVQPRDY